jgi:hypothetical protein
VARIVVRQGGGIWLARDDEDLDVIEDELSVTTNGTTSTINSLASPNGVNGANGQVPAQASPQPNTPTSVRMPDVQTDSRPPEVVTDAPARRTTADPDVAALATLLADVELWCPDPRLRAKLKAAWMIPAAEAMLDVANSGQAVEVEWGVEWPALGVVGCRSEEDARRIVKEQNFGNVKVVSREVRTVGPWAPPSD